MNKYLLMLTLMALLPTGVSAQHETAEQVRERVAMISAVLERIELAKTDREAAATVFAGAHEAAERIVEDQGSLEALPDELDTYFRASHRIMAAEFGPVPDATRDLIAEAFVRLAIAQPDHAHWHYRVADAGSAGFERVDEALFEIYSAMRKQEQEWRAYEIIQSFGNLPPEQALPYLSRIAAQQDADVDAIGAVKIMAQAGQEGADAIMGLDRAGTMNDYVEWAIRWGRSSTDEVCPHVPDFTPCVQNESLGSPRGIGTPFPHEIEIDCRSLPSIRDRFPAEEYQAMQRMLCGGSD